MTKGRFKPGDPRAGRKPGVPNKATAGIKAAAQLYGEEAIEKLAALMRGNNPEVAPKACNAHLDRAYGKPAQTIAGDSPIEEAAHLATRNHYWLMLYPETGHGKNPGTGARSPRRL
ncbi:MAG: hypothetical protein WBX25_33890 [Rhodomicrobium sp.]